MENINQDICCGPAQHDYVDIIVTRHAVNRFKTRARGERATGRNIARQIADATIEAFECDRLVHVDGSIYLAPVVLGRGVMCAVVSIDGPAEKPFRATVCTLLTREMAAATHGHRTGLLGLLSTRAQA